MGASVNSCALLVGLAAFAGWTLSPSTVPRRVGWVNLLGGLGILALFFSIVSPDDDGFQQELIRPATPCVKISAHTRVAPRRSPPDPSINISAATVDPIEPLKKARLIGMDQPLEVDTCFHAPISIHSPPVAS
jgi:hypothetical protein